MEIQQRVRGVVLGRVHSLGGNLVRMGEGLQHFARPPELATASPVAELAAAPAVAETVEPKPEPQVLEPQIVEEAPKLTQRKAKKARRR